jgi:hypothetical protein
MKYTIYKVTNYVLINRSQLVDTLDEAHDVVRRMKADMDQCYHVPNDRRTVVITQIDLVIPDDLPFVRMMNLITDNRHPFIYACQRSEKVIDTI